MDASMSHERMRISSGGNVNITNSLSIAGNQIYNYLFNNTGGTIEIFEVVQNGKKRFARKGFIEGL
jgi:hypothetical protein